MADRCGGLRQALLSEWATAFPLEPSPFHSLARRHGGSAREMLLHCQTLQREGATAGVRLHWAPALRGASRRVMAWGAPDDVAAAAPALAAAPGLSSWNERLDGAVPGPALWADLEGRDAAALHAQAQALAEATPRLRWATGALSPPAEPSTCRCHHGGGPCADPALARLCERALPMVARPFRALAVELQRSERALLQTLRNWRCSGRLSHAGLARTLPRASAVRVLGALAGPPLEASVVEALLRQSSIVRVMPGCADEAAGWPWTTLVECGAPPAAAPELLARAFAACGLRERAGTLLTVRQHRVRDEPLLFADQPG